MKSKKEKSFKLLIIITIILLMVCIYTLILLLKEVEEEKTEEQVATQSINITIQQIIERNGSTYIKDKSCYIYVTLKHDLYDSKGNSNQQYFENLVEDLAKIEELENQTFYLLDEEKDITIIAKYNKEKEKHEVFYNYINNFYGTVDGYSYSIIDKIENIEKVKLSYNSKELDALIDGSMFLREVEEMLGEGLELDNGYTSYKDGSILLDISKNNLKVKSIIFTDKYQEEVFDDIKVGTDLNEIEEKYGELVYGSSEQGYIMCRNEDIYAFFYEDEIAVYSYGYVENENFEEYLVQYLADKDLETFSKKVIRRWKNYYKYEYDFETGYVHITYPSRGVEILIEDNNPIGITLYKNYYFTDTTKELVKAGKISINDKQDYLEITEKNRRDNKEVKDE